MPRKSGAIEERLARFDEICAQQSTASVLAASRDALCAPQYRLVARAAEICAERLFYDLEPDLIAAYGRFLDRAAKGDPQCTAKGAIVHALVGLDCQDAAFYRAGMRYRQPEPVWGGSVDTAVELRNACAMGLVGTASPRVLADLVEMLVDPEHRARIGAVRAIACTEPLAAEAVLRAAALRGDAEPEVTGECLAALLRLEPDESPAFVDRFLDRPDPEVREVAALALGDSRLDAALVLLRARWGREPLKRAADRVLLRAAVFHRSPTAFDWLLSVVAEGDHESAALVIEELALYHANAKLRQRLREVVTRRGDPKLQQGFARAWKE